MMREDDKQEKIEALEKEVRDTIEEMGGLDKAQKKFDELTVKSYNVVMLGGIKWYRDGMIKHLPELMLLFHTIRERDLKAIREMDDTALTNLCNLAHIGTLSLVQAESAMGKAGK